MTKEDWIRENNIKVGDKVRVVREPDPIEFSWWIEAMDECVGLELGVGDLGLLERDDDITEESVFLKYTKDPFYSGFWFPHFVLEKVSEQQPQKTDMCPRCSATLTRVMSYAYNVEIDKCPACGWC